VKVLSSDVTSLPEYVPFGKQRSKKRKAITRATRHSGEKTEPLASISTQART
ncbi:unnamed protein product, partial [Ilex paraguariensis]